MKKLLFILFVVLSLTASAQKIRFTDSINQWITDGADQGCAFGCIFYYGSDTVINSQTYKQLNMRYNPYVLTLGCMRPGGAGGKLMFVREDTIANIVYCRGSTSYLFDTMEQILYNYNLQVGDTIQYLIGGAPIVDSVVNIDSVIINGIYHKVFTMNGRNNATPMITNPNTVWRAYTVIEGIGCTDDPELPAFFTGCFEYTESLTCFTQDTFSPSITTAYYLCSLYDSPIDSFRNCKPLAVHNIQKQISSLILFPNPAYNELTITSPQNITIITITNLIGQTVYTHEYNTTQIDIDVANLPSGIYFVKVQFGGAHYDNHTEVRKFVKE